MERNAAKPFLLLKYLPGVGKNRLPSEVAMNVDSGDDVLHNALVPYNPTREVHRNQAPHWK